MAVGRAKIAATVKIRAESTKQLFQKLGQRSFPSAYLDEVASFPADVAEEVLTQLPPLQAPLSDPLSQEAQLRQLKRYGLLLEHVHQVAEFLESSDVLAIPASISLYLQDVVAGLIPNGRLVLRADNDFNYSFEPLADVINDALSTSGLIARLPKPLALLKFPSAAKEDALLHAILAHEIGHFLDQSNDLSSAVLAEAGADQYQEIEDAIITQLKFDQSKTGDRVLLRRAMGVFYSWIAELLSDLVGVHLLGPAFALAMIEFQGFEEDPSEGSLTHPPTDIRQYLIQEELRALGWFDNVLTPGQLWAEMGPYAARKVVDTWTFEKKLAELMADKISAYLPACQLVVRNLFSGKSFKPTQFQTDDTPMRSLLENYIPPAESPRADGTASPFSAESIINGCWLFWSEDTPGWAATKDNPYESRLLLGRLLLKALEVSRIRIRLT